MDQHYRKLYFHLTRNQNLTIGSKKYLPIQKQTINYDSVLNIRQNIKQVKQQMNINNRSQQKLKQSRKQIQSKINLKSDNIINKIILQEQKIIKNPEHINQKAIAYIQLAGHLKRKPIIKNKNGSTSIIIMNNQQQQDKQQQTESINHKIKNLKIKQKIKIHSNNIEFKPILKNNKKSLQNIQLKQLKIQKQQQKLQILIDNDNLDSYIDKYLSDLKKNNPTIKQNIQQNRQKFIQQAIMNIKDKIIQDMKSKTITQTQRNYKNQLVNLENSRQKYKSLEKSVSKQKKKNKINSNLNMHTNNQIQSNIYELPLLPKRHIYEKTPSNNLTRIGKAFYLNQINQLQINVALQAKHRERAQRVFKRKLNNIDKISFSSWDKYHSQQLMKQY